MSGSSVTTLRTRSSWRTGSSWRRHRLSRRSPCSLCRVGTTWCARWSLPGSCTRHCPTATSRSSPTPGTQWGRSALQRGWSKYQMILPKLVEPIHRELLWLHAFLAWQNVDGLENICNTNVYFYILLYFALIIMYKCWFLVKKSFCSWQYSQWGDYILWFRTSFFNVGFLCVQKKFIRTWAYSSHKNMSIFLPQTSFGQRRLSLFRYVADPLRRSNEKYRVKAIIKCITVLWFGCNCLLKMQSFYWINQPKKIRKNKYLWGFTNW